MKKRFFFCGWNEIASWGNRKYILNTWKFWVSQEECQSLHVLCLMMMKCFSFKFYINEYLCLITFICILSRSTGSQVFKRSSFLLWKTKNYLFTYHNLSLLIQRWFKYLSFWFLFSFFSFSLSDVSPLLSLDAADPIPILPVSLRTLHSPGQVPGDGRYTPRWGVRAHAERSLQLMVVSIAGK